ncbi:uncharacterized protein [Musca autumnalis]|uniref:uncharacterized protein n=1 Tax=Musca autumnalis TaxID=221902 RepID=UPI003CF83DAD
MNLKNSQLLQILTLLLLLTKSINSSNQLLENLQKDQSAIYAFKQQLKYLFQKVDREQGFESCIVIGGYEKNIKHNSVAEVLQEDLGKTLIFYSYQPLICRGCQKLNKNFLVFIFWNYGEEEKFTNYLALTLDYRRQNRVILLAPDDLSEVFAEIVMRHVFQECMRTKLINVIILLANFRETKIFYAFEMFPRFEIVNRSIDARIPEFFPNKISNLYGRPIRTYPDQRLPRSAVYRDDNGRIRMIGYVMSFLETFAKSLNATLTCQQYLAENRPAFYKDIFDMANWDRFDVPASLVPALYVNTSKIMSTFYEMRALCIMVPIEQPQSYEQFISHSLNLKFFLQFSLSMVVLSVLIELATKIMYLQRNQKYTITLDKLLLNTKIFRGVFGFSFQLQSNPPKSLKILYTVLFLRGLLVTVQFSAILQSFLTHPLVPHVSHIKDLQANNLKIVVFKNDFDFIKQSRGVNYKRFLSSIKVVDDYNKYRQLHSSFNTSYAYPVHYSQWYIYNTQQRSLAQPLFRLSGMCLQNMGMMGFVLPQNSYYLQPLNKLIRRVNELGFPQYWLHMSYIELKKIGKIKDIPNPKQQIPYRTMGPEEFTFIFQIMMRVYFCAFILLVIEKIHSKIYCKIECRLK